MVTLEESIRRGRSEDPGSRDPLDILRGLGLLLADGQLSRAAVVSWHSPMPAIGAMKKTITGCSSLFFDITGSIINAMSTATKLLNAMRQNPNDWQMSKLLTVARQHGVEVRSTGGSHHVFSHPSVKDPLSVPAHRPIKAGYVRRFIALIDQIQE